MVHIPEDNLPAREVGDCYCAAYEIPEPNQTRVIALLDAVDDEAFWSLPRKLQAVMLLQRRKEFKVRQTDIATVLGVSDSTVTKYKYDFLEHPENLFPLTGRPSKIRDVFPHVENFIREQWAKGRSLPLGVLIEYLADKHHVFVTRKCLREYMINHGYPYVMGIPTDAMRVAVPNTDLEAFYMRSLPEALRGVHPSLVFNMDEMGAERHPDAKQSRCLSLKSTTVAKECPLAFLVHPGE